MFFFAYLDPKKDLLCGLRYVSRALRDLVDAEVVTYRFKVFATSVSTAAHDGRGGGYVDDDAEYTGPVNPLCIQKVQTVISTRSYNGQPKYPKPGTHTIHNPDRPDIDMLFLPCWELAALSAPDPIPWKDVDQYNVRIERSDWDHDQAIMLWKRWSTDTKMHFNIDVPDECCDIIGFGNSCDNSRQFHFNYFDKYSIELFRRPRDEDEETWEQGCFPFESEEE